MVHQLTGFTKNFGGETLCNNRWYCRWSLFFLIANKQARLYICNVISPLNPLCRWNHHDNLNGIRFKTLFSRTVKFNDSFFPSCVVDWNELDEIFKKAINKKFFQSSLVKLVSPPKSNNFNILDNLGLMYLTQLRVGLNRYKFDHNFNDTIDPMCSVNDGVEDSTHLLLSCHLYTDIRIVWLNSVSRITGMSLILKMKQLLSFLFAAMKRNIQLI